MRHFAARRASAAAAAAAAANGDEDRSVETAALSAMRVLSLMSGAQAQEMRDLEREYEKVLDVNCKAYALYLKKILEAGETSTVTSPPPPPPELVFGVGDSDGDDDHDEDDTPETDEAVSSQNDVRYNPMWAEADDLYPRRQGRRDLTRPPSLYPQRVPPHLIVQQQQSPPVGRGSPASRLRAEQSQSPVAPSDDSMEESSSELYGGKEEKRAASPLSEPRLAAPRPRGDEDARQLSPEPASSPMLGAAEPVVATPKDFVCPITSQVFDDPVTLETGQTYERRAIQEWLNRGNATCPVTRQRLHGAYLPSTNYVLKRLIAAWRDHHPPSSCCPWSSSPGTTTMDSPAATPPPPPFKVNSSPSPDNSTTTSSHASAPSPTSVIAQATLETAVGDVRAAVSCLCTSEDLTESEKSVLRIERLWREAAGAEHAVLAAALARPAVVNGFVEILFNSVTAQVLQTAVFLLAELASRDDAVVQTLTRVDSDVDCLVALFKKGLVEAVVLICLLSPTPEQLVEMDMADALVAAIRGGDEDPMKMCVKPKAASVILLSQILVDGGKDDSATSPVPRSALLSERFIRSVAASLEAEQVEERLAAVRILLRCIGEDGHCRSSIVEKSSLGAVLDAFHAVGDADKFDVVRFLFELLKLKKRSAADRVLRTIKEGGSFSMMHTLLVYLQSVPPEHGPVVAGLLVQLDLLVLFSTTSVYKIFNSSEF